MKPASLLIAGLLLAGESRAETPPDLSLYRIALRGAPGEVEALRAAGIDVAGHRGPWAEIVAGARDVEELMRRGYSPVLLERGRPYREIDLERRGPLDPDPQYKTDVEIATALLEMEQLHPAIARRLSLQATYGAPPTWEGRTIHVLKISDNPALDEDEPAVLIVSNHHARELITPEIALDTASRLLAGYGVDPRITRWIDASEIFIAPTWNPDGLAFVWSSNNMWRKNRRDNGGGVFGVDQNRNYPFQWGACSGGSTNPSSEVYQGPAAASEPETRAMMALSAAEHFAKVIDFHSYGEVVLYDHGCARLPVLPGAAQAAGAQAYGAAVAYAPQPVGSTPGMHYPWQVATRGPLSFLVETGTSFQPTYPTALQVVQRMRPGMDGLLDAPIPLSGHVRDLHTGAPLVADIAVAGIVYTSGETRRSEGRFGRYHYWLPAGDFDVTFTSPTYRPLLRTGVTIAAGSGTALEVGLEPKASIEAAGSPRIGEVLELRLSSPDDGGLPYLAGAALSSLPGIPLAGRILPLNPDPLFFAVPFLPGIFEGFAGFLSGAGTATARVLTPAEPSLAGLTLHFAFLTWTGTEVRSLSSPRAVALTR